MEYEKLKSAFLVPPGGWRYKDKDSGKVIEAGSKMGLIEMVRNDRIFRGLPIGKNIALQVEHQICRRLPDKYVKNRRTPLSGVMIRMHDIEKNTQKLLTDWVKSGRRLVDDNKVIQRAEICQKCENNLRIGCLSCRGIDRQIYSWIGRDRKTNYDEVLHVCKIGSVFLIAMIHMELDDIPNSAGVTENCWRRTEVVNE